MDKYKLTKNLDIFSKFTPIILIDSNVIKQHYELLLQIKNSKIYYQVKQNPHDDIIKFLQGLGSQFDCQSLEEIKLVKQYTNDSSKISFGNTIKKKEEIEEQYNLFKIRRFQVDSEMEIDKIQEFAPNSEVYIRLSMDGMENKQDWQLTKKFGTTIQHQIKLQGYQKEKMLDVIGVSFHVGSQNYYPESFEKQLYQQKIVFDEVWKEYRIKMRMVNIGGGLPQKYTKPIPDYEKYINIINNYLDKWFDNDIEVMVEPGRSLVQDQGILITKVLLRSMKYNIVDNSVTEWLYLDQGIFHGLFESIGGIKYRVSVHGKENSDIYQTFVLQGPSCDSMDIIGEYELPQDVTIDDLIIFHSQGQYTNQYNTKFNGVRPPILILI